VQDGPHECLVPGIPHADSHLPANAVPSNHAACQPLTELDMIQQSGLAAKIVFGPV